MQDIESEGNKVTSQSDLLGQRIYVASGDPWREVYRLSTFHHYPRDSPVDPRQLAARGFYYTGYGDRVKCFSCGQHCGNWLLGDDVSSPDWHELDCDFVNGRDTNNVSLELLSRQNQPDQNNGSSPTVNRGNSSVSNYSDSIFHQFSVGETLTISSSSNFSGHSNVNRNSPVSFSPNILETLPRIESVPSSANDGSLIDQRRRSSENFRDIFPCFHPVNPHMRTKEARLQTFLDNSSIWPAHRIRATPQQIVDAGMYYLGERDRVKCWYCNGGLQNWERNDNPWEEHAKWFPLCEYVLQQKGPDYVHEIVSRFPGLRRPTLYNPSTSQAAQTLTQTVTSESNHVPLTSQNGLSSHPIIIDPKQEIAQRNRKISEEIKSSTNVAQARMMGFKVEVIKEALKRQYELHNQSFSNFHDFVEAILSIPDLDGSTEALDAPSSTAATYLPESSQEPNLAPAQQEVNRLEASRKCKKCRRKDACMVFVPCGHLACCISCSERMERCVICREFIGEKLRSFIS